MKKFISSILLFSNISYNNTSPIIIFTFVRIKLYGFCKVAYGSFKVSQVEIFNISPVEPIAFISRIKFYSSAEVFYGFVIKANASVTKSPVIENYILMNKYSLDSEKVKEYLLELEKSQWLSKQQLEEIQLSQLKKLIHYAYNNFILDVARVFFYSSEIL